MRLNPFGVVLAGDPSIADLEDPGSKRVYAYRLVNSVAGGTIRAIESSHIVLERRNPRLEVQLLHDPSRPKPSLPSSWPRPKVSIPRPVQSQPTAGPTP